MRWLLVLILFLMPRMVIAAPVCTPPKQIALPRAVAATPDEPVRQARIVGYTLALSWAPEYCHRRHGPEDALECDGALAHRFVLHGLWPDAADPKGWPQYCRPAALLPEPVLRANLCMTPSAQLLQHEWAKHGSCMAATPDAYFAKAAAAFAVVRFPHMGELAQDRGLTAGALQQAFADANPGAPAAAFAIDANRAGWLEEVHLCLGLDLHARACPAGSGGAAPDARLRIETGLGNAAGFRNYGGSPGYRPWRSRDSGDRGDGE